MKLKFTEEQVFDLASKIYDEVNEGEGFGDLKEQNAFVKKDWVDAAYDAICGYNTVVEYINSTDILDDDDEEAYWDRRLKNRTLNERYPFHSIARR